MPELGHTGPPTGYVPSGRAAQLVFCVYRPIMNVVWVWVCTQHETILRDRVTKLLAYLRKDKDVQM